MLFHYIASQSDGKILEGDVESQGVAEALEFLASRGLRPVSLKVVKGFREIGKGRIFGHKITIEDKVFLTKYLALMLKVGTDLFKAIDILIVDFDKPAVKSLLMEIRGSLEKGQPFYATFAKYPKHFSTVFVNLVKAGEASGNLERVFGELSVSLQKEQDLRHKIRSALTYPILLLLLSSAMLAFLVTFALPKIANVFISSGVKPPTFSRIVFSVGLFLNEYLFYILGLVIILGFSVWYVFSKTIAGRRIINRFFVKIPVIKDILKQLAFQRFASTLGSLLAAGLPILDSLEITADAVGYEELKDSLIRISREGIAKGLTIGDAFRRESIFPRVVANLVAISEKAGHIEDILGTLANFYEAEIETSIKIMISFLEPVMLMGIGAIIGTIALAIIVPVYQLVGQF
jgi:type IV pilus assembly protein PilC